MKLNDDDRAKIATFAKEAALRHYRQHNPGATEAEAFSFASRQWRSPAFLQAACDCLAFEVAIDQAIAAPLN